MPPVPAVVIPQDELDAMDGFNNVVNCDGMPDEYFNQNDQVGGHVNNGNNNNRNNDNNNNNPNPNVAGQQPMGDNGIHREEFQAKKMRPVWFWREVVPGMFAYVKYFGLPHAVLITGKDEARGVVKGIHYKLPGLLSARVISEDEFAVNLRNDDLFEVYVPDGQRRPPEEAVARATARLGQHGFNMFYNRSSHVVRECVMR